MNLLDPQGWAANRRGEITELQSQRLHAGTSLVNGCGAALILIPTFLVVPLFGLASYSALANDDLPFAFLFLVLTLALIVASATVAARLWKWFTNALKRKRDQENRAISQAQGQLAFDKQGYFFRAGERRLLLPSAEQTGGLLPGATYRVFYLSESGLVLSAEEVSPASPAQAQTALLDFLAQANNFTLGDLMHNCNGHVTVGQRMQLLRRVVTGAALVLIALTLGGVFLFLVYPNVDPKEALAILLLSALFFGALAVFNGWTFLSGLLDMLAPSIKQAQGIGHKHAYIGRCSAHYYYAIADKMFEVNRRAYTVLREGMHYRVYYLPRTEKLVSIEPVSVAADVPETS
ncbi:MAG: hypothetical protein ACUVSX_16655 [Aggregatilineales bacterium]